jgi:outer membrane protein insertion porin family
MKYRLRNSDNKVKEKAFKEKEPNEQKRILREREEKTEGIISGIGTYISYDSTDNSYRPHQGVRSLFETEYIGLGGKYDFFKFGYLNSYYYPLWSKGTLKYRFDFKFIEVFGSLNKTTKASKVPLSERFFLGGETTVRGYKPYIIGPTMPDTDNDPMGGVSSMLLSIEYNQEIIKPLIDVFFFIDAGSVSFKKLNINTPRTSVGAGVRLEIMPRVPMTVGFGFPINPKKHDDIQHVFFYMGGQF